MSRKIERPEHCDDAVGLESRRRRRARDLPGRWLPPLAVRFDRGGDLMNHRVGFGRGFPSRLAGLATNGVGEVGAVLLDLLAKGMEELRALGDVQAGPLFKRFS